jgi:hypothetical protein
MVSKALLFELFFSVVSFLMSLFPIKLRSKGSQQEVLYSLMTYGIPTELLPVSCNNEIKRSNHLEMLKMARKKEEYYALKGRNGDKCVIIPYVNDILLAKGGPSQGRPGNIRLKMMADELLTNYNTLGKNEKCMLAKDVVQTMKQGGARFLVKDTGVWMVVPDQVARSKVAMMFRNRRKVSQKAAKSHEAVKAPRRDDSIGSSSCDGGTGESKRSRM